MGSFTIKVERDALECGCLYEVVAYRAARAGSLYGTDSENVFYQLQNYYNCGAHASAPLQIPVIFTDNDGFTSNSYAALRDDAIATLNDVLDNYEGA